MEPLLSAPPKGSYLDTLLAKVTKKENHWDGANFLKDALARRQDGENATDLKAALHSWARKVRLVRALSQVDASIISTRYRVGILGIGEAYAKHCEEEERVAQALLQQIEVMREREAQIESMGSLEVYEAYEPIDVMIEPEGPEGVPEESEPEEELDRPAQAEGVQLDTVQLDTVQLDTVQLDTVLLDTVQLDTVVASVASILPQRPCPLDAPGPPVPRTEEELEEEYASHIDATIPEPEPLTQELQEWADELFDVVDTDDSGEITLEEFCDFIQFVGQDVDKPWLRGSFRRTLAAVEAKSLTRDQFCPWILRIRSNLPPSVRDGSP